VLIREVDPSSEGTRRAKRVAVIADVHGNAPALRAVLGELAGSEADLFVSLGDATWGIQPEETRELLQAVELPAIFVAGNGERALRELRDGRDGTARERWMLDHHSPATYAFLDTFVEHAVVHVDGLGDVRFCHGSPRNDTELVTPATPEHRIRAMTEGVPEQVVLTAHTHLQFDRDVAGIRSVNPGSVGMPYAEQPGAFWALLGPDVELRRTSYDLEETARAYRESDDPAADAMIETLLAPPGPDEVTAHAEAHEFSE
jgi:putative phosphoesterase